MIGVALLGATGRMGRSVLPLIAASDDLELTGALAARGNPAIGQDAGACAGLAPLGSGIASDARQAVQGAQVAIDFTRPAASVVHATACARLGCPLVIGTTGHSPAERSALEAAAARVAIVLAPNMSLGVNLLLRLA